MNIIKDFINMNSNNRPGTPIIIKYITIHNTDNEAVGADAKAHSLFLKSTDKYVSWHYTVDNKIIYQHLPDNEKGYHTATEEGNKKSIGIEICVNKNGNIKDATDNAVDLVVKLIKKYKISTKNIKQHFDWSKKNCPSYIRSGNPYDWDTFIKKVEEKLMNYEQATKILQDNDIMSNPEYWSHVNICVKYFEELVINMANYIENNK